MGGCSGVEESCAGEERDSEVCVWLLSVASTLLKICTEEVALSQYVVVRCTSALLEHTEAYVVKPRSLALVLALVLVVRSSKWGDVLTRCYVIFCLKRLSYTQHLVWSMSPCLKGVLSHLVLY